MITKIEYLIDGVIFETVTSAPFDAPVTLINDTSGNHVLTAKMYYNNILYRTKVLNFTTSLAPIAGMTSETNTFMTEAGIPYDNSPYLGDGGRNNIAIWDAIDEFVVSLQTSGVWDKVVYIKPRVGGTLAAHGLNLKDPFAFESVYQTHSTGTNVWSADIKGDTFSGVQSNNNRIKINLSSDLVLNRAFEIAHIDNFSGTSKSLITSNQDISPGNEFQDSHFYDFSNSIALYKPYPTQLSFLRYDSFGEKRIIRNENLVAETSSSGQLGATLSPETFDGVFPLIEASNFIGTLGLTLLIDSPTRTQGDNTIAAAKLLESKIR